MRRWLLRSCWRRRRSSWSAAAPAGRRRSSRRTGGPGHSINPVRLLVRGTNLHGARVESAGPGLQRVERQGQRSRAPTCSSTSPSPATLRPARAPLTHPTAGGSAAAPFEVSAPLPREGRFQGFSSRRRDLPGHARPLRERRPVERRSAAVAAASSTARRAATTTAATSQGVIDHLPYLKSSASPRSG